MKLEEEAAVITRAADNTVDRMTPADYACRLCAYEVVEIDEHTVPQSHPGSPHCRSAGMKHGQETCSGQRSCHSQCT